MHKDAEKLAEEVQSTLDKYGLNPRQAFLSSNCKVPLALFSQDASDTPCVQDEEDLVDLQRRLGMEVVQFKDSSHHQLALKYLLLCRSPPSCRGSEPSSRHVLSLECLQFCCGQCRRRG